MTSFVPEKQVDKAHYEFDRYVTKRRWASVWHQVDEVIRFKPESVLEIGPGPGVFKALAQQLGMNIKTLDIDPALRPDYVASATNMPFEDGHFDVACAFQMLEHVPYDASLQIFNEMTRVSRKGVVISLPDSARRYRVGIYIPRIGERHFFYPVPRFGIPHHRFDGEHHWELSKRGFSVRKVVGDFSRCARLVKTFRVPEFTYHRFFVFSK